MSGPFQVSINPGSVDLTVFCAPRGFYDYIRRPQDHADSPIFFLRVKRQVIAGLDSMRMCLDAIVLYATPEQHVP